MRWRFCAIPSISGRAMAHITPQAEIPVCLNRTIISFRLADSTRTVSGQLPLQAMLKKCSARQEKIIPAIRPALSLSIPIFLPLSR